jgi:hypothetical protein
MLGALGLGATWLARYARAPEFLFGDRGLRAPDFMLHELNQQRVFEQLFQRHTPPINEGWRATAGALCGLVTNDAFLLSLFIPPVPTSFFLVLSFWMKFLYKKKREKKRKRKGNQGPQSHFFAPLFPFF